ncbi:MAG: nicotinamide-nucleotide adenylyltransferase [Candidatus Diapherotrites archaeon]
MKRGLIVGRFQPYHLGHHNAIKNILKEVDEVVIVVGSTMESYLEEDPFTAGERVEMISRALKAEGIFEKCFIIPVPNVDEYALWTGRIRSYTPNFDVVYSNNPLVKKLFEADGVEVRKMVSNRREIDSVKIRKAMMNGTEWKQLVPKEVADYLNKLGAVERLKAIIEEEKKQ